MLHCVPSTTWNGRHSNKLAGENDHPRDAKISFDSRTHTYTVEGDSDYTSVTTLVKGYFKPFNPLLVAQNMVAKHNFRTHPRYERYKQFYSTDNPTTPLLVERIVESWVSDGKTQSALGTQLHDYIEFFYNETLHARVAPCKSQSDPVAQFYKFHDWTRREGWKPFRTEWRVYDQEYKISGTVDMLYYNPKTQTYHLVDWKRSKGIKYTGFGSGLYPCEHIPDCNYYHYTLQLNIYLYILEKHYGIQVEDMRLVVMHPNQSNYKMHQIFKQSNPSIQDLLTMRGATPPSSGCALEFR